MKTGNMNGNIKNRICKQQLSAQLGTKSWIYGSYLETKAKLFGLNQSYKQQFYGRAYILKSRLSIIVMSAEQLSQAI